MKDYLLVEDVVDEIESLWKIEMSQFAKLANVYLRFKELEKGVEEADSARKEMFSVLEDMIS